MVGDPDTLHNAAARGSSAEVAELMTRCVYKPEALRVALIRATQGPPNTRVQCLEVMLERADFTFACPDTNTALDFALRHERDELDEYVVLLLSLSRVPSRTTTIFTAEREVGLRARLAVGIERAAHWRLRRDATLTAVLNLVVLPAAVAALVAEYSTPSVPEVARAALAMHS